MTPEQTNPDTTIEEIHRTREQMAAKFGHDIAAILADARKRQEVSGIAIWRGQLTSQESTQKEEAKEVK